MTRNTPQRKHGSSDFKRVYLDLEVSPEFNATYGKHHEASVLHTEKYQYLFCFSYKVNDGPVRVVALPDFPLYKEDPMNDRALAEALYDILSDADLMICHNVNFDVRMARARFMYHGFAPLRPSRTFCTLSWARRNLMLNSYSLKSVARFFGLTEKMETSKGLWQAIHYEGKRWGEMRRYNKIDTQVCSEIYQKIVAWDAKAAPITLQALCQGCGSDDVEWRGWTQSKRPKRQFKCLSCGRWGSA